MRLRKATSLLLAAAACVAVGCGSDEEPKPSIPASASAQLMQRLDSVQGRFEFGDGACNDIPDDQRLVNDEIASLPKSVDADVRNALQDSFDHLFDLTSDQCDKDKGQDTDTDTTPTETTTETQTTETTTETQTTDTEPTDTTPTETVPPDTTTIPPNNGNGNGNGGGAQGPQE